MIDRNTREVRGSALRAGFRPFVHRLASRLGLVGRVKAFVPQRSTVAREVNPEPIDSDLAICVDCLVELFDPDDRRFRDSFIACGHCGPRWSMSVPSPSPGDRGAPACPKCLAEFEDPASRRFRVASIACSECGPRLWFEEPEAGDLDPIGATVAALLQGKIGALKGTGGYHLACDATLSDAVERLKGLKRREGRPLPIMVANLSAARTLCEVNEQEAALLSSPRRPIVILKKRPGPSILADEVAGESPWLGVMLPYTAMHFLILHALRGLPLVMTGGHSSGEPIAYDDLGARKWLKTIADFYLSHDRPILIRSDDSVTRFVAGGETILRRSRGHGLEPITLGRDCPVPILALGAQRSGTFCLGQGDQAVLSHYLSDLRNFEASRAFEKAIDHFEDRLGFEPELIAHEFDPDDVSNFHAQRRGVEMLGVQHHHAHVASCMAENGLDETVIGVVLDGEALGGDGSLWGGEFLVASYDGFRRAGQFRSIPMPGRDASILKPWRMALTHLIDASEDPNLMGRRLKRFELKRVETILKGRIDAPGTSSVARLFDAVAVLAGFRRDVEYEGQAADEMEWRSSELEPDHAYPFEVSQAEDRPRLIVDTRPLISAIARDLREGVEAARIGRRFHSTVVEAIARVCGQIRSKEGLNVVTLSGSVFLNKLLLEETILRLERDGFEVHHHRRVPTHDGGLSLGQVAVAAAWSARNRERALESAVGVVA